MIQASLLSDQAYEHLLFMIWRSELPPGCWLREAELSAQLGISRTPVREALRRLATRGLVDLKPHYGIRLRRLTPGDVHHVFQMRLLLEGYAVKLACTRVTAGDLAHLAALAPRLKEQKSDDFAVRCMHFGRELHALAAERSGNPILCQEIQRLHDLTHLASNLKTPESLTSFRMNALQEHLRILAALKARDPKASRQAMRDHLRSVRTSLMKAILSEEKKEAVT
ncbi:MAG TPA: GntR family transcriptional regulator [Gemmataceae bacterium]|jgi:DNA-binding GntR family transcriptional regulator